MYPLHIKSKGNNSDFWHHKHQLANFISFKVHFVLYAIRYTKIIENQNCHVSFELVCIYRNGMQHVIGISVYFTTENIKSNGTKDWSCVL